MLVKISGDLCWGLLCDKSHILWTTTTNQNMPIVCLTGTWNYSACKTQVSQVLQYEGLWDAVSTLRSPDWESECSTSDGIVAHQNLVAAAAHAYQQAWDGRSLQSIEVIHGTVKHQILGCIRQYNIVRELWQHLGIKFGEQENTATMKLVNWRREWVNQHVSIRRSCYIELHVNEMFHLIHLCAPHNPNNHDHCHYCHYPHQPIIVVIITVLIIIVLAVIIIVGIAIIFIAVIVTGVFGIVHLIVLNFSIAVRNWSL